MTRLLTILAMLLIGSAAASGQELQSAPADTVASKGRLMWVPDSMVKPMQQVMSGRYKVVRDASVIDFDEKVRVNGDTVNMVMRDRNYSRFDRGLFNYLFIPKSSWMFGITASYGEFTSTDMQLLDLITDFDFKGHTYSIRPYISYFVRNNLSIGLRFAFTNSKGRIGELGVDFDEDLNFNLEDVSYRNEALTASMFARQYIGLSRKGRFGVFNELALSFSSGNADFRRPYNGTPKNTRTSYSEIGLNFSPGVSVFINKYASFNVSFGVVGFYMRNEKQSVDGEYSGNRFTSGANFRFNLFNINFGLGIHL